MVDVIVMSVASSKTWCIVVIVSDVARDGCPQPNDTIECSTQ